MHALLKPFKPQHDQVIVELIARTGNGKIKVRNAGVLPSAGPWIRAVDRFRLFQIDARLKRITDADFARLPWQGAGADPEAKSIDALLANGELAL